MAVDLQPIRAKFQGTSAQWDELLRFMRTGEATDEFGDELDRNENWQNAVCEVFAEEVRPLHEFLESLESRA